MENINNQIIELDILCQEIIKLNELIDSCDDKVIKKEYINYMSHLIQEYSTLTSSLKKNLKNYFTKSDVINFSYKKLYKLLSI